MENKVWAVPLPSSPEVLKSKNISIRTYALLLLYSNWGGTLSNDNTRFLYDNKLSDNVNEILTTLNISRNTLRKHLFNLRTLSKGIFKSKMVNDELVHMLAPKDKEGKNFVVIKSDILLKLICNCSENCIRIYIILCYVCRDGSRQLTHQWLSESIGNSSNSRRLISKAVNELESFNFISIERTKKVHKVLNESTGRIICNPKDVHYYSLTSK